MSDQRSTWDHRSATEGHSAKPSGGLVRASRAMGTREVERGVVERVRLTQPTGQFVWDAREARGGVYSILLMARGQVLATEKVVLQP